MASVPPPPCLGKQETRSLQLTAVASSSQVTFSDDSDLDDPPAALEREDKGPAPRRVRSVASNKVTQPSGSSKKATAERKGSQASSSDNVSQGSTARPQRGGAGMKKALRGRTALRAPSREQEEDQELLRAITEEETLEEELELSFEVLRGSDEEGPAPGRLRESRGCGDRVASISGGCAAVDKAPAGLPKGGSGGVGPNPVL